MSDNDNAQAGNTINTVETTQQPQAMQVNVRMQQGEHTGQPIYSNFTTVQGGQGVVMVDFGFLDPQTIQAINRMAQSGEKVQTVHAKMSCRMALSPDAALQLARQLTQLLQSARNAGASSPQQ